MYRNYKCAGCSYDMRYYAKCYKADPLNRSLITGHLKLGWVPHQGCGISFSEYIENELRSCTS